MNPYLQFSVLKFKNSLVYRFEYLTKILNSVLSFVVYYSIYRALYGTANEVDGVTFSMVATNFLISLGLSSAFAKNEGFLPGKIKDGSIANELLRPVNFKLRMLFEDLGAAFFNVCFHFLPTLIIACFFAELSAPSDALHLFMSLISAGFGFLILWHINFLVQCLSFWVINVWSLTTLKNVLLKLLAGSLIPLWFMPEGLKKLIDLTPFGAIYFIPVQLYLGNLSGSDVLWEFARQFVWILILAGMCEVLWKRGIKKLVVHGG